MVKIRAFAALRPPRDRAAEVASPPYDVVTRDEADALIAANPRSFMAVLLSADAPGAFARLREAGDLAPDPERGIYLYRLTRQGRTQTGVACLSAVEDYESGHIKVHERTRPAKVQDRTDHMLALKAHPGPLFLTYRAQDAITRLTREATAAPAELFDFTDETGVRHEGWRAPDAAALIEAFAALPASYIADGHHRAASAARAAREGGGDAMLTVLFPAAELTILPYHRVVKAAPTDWRHRVPLEGAEDGLARHSVDSSAEAPAVTVGRAKAEGATAGDTPVPGEVRIYADGGWWRHRLAGDGLDCARLQEHVLGPVFGIDDPRTNDGIEFIGGARGTAYLERLVDSGQAAVAFSMYPTSIEQVLAVSDAGEVMPPKSTWFEPKLKSGLFVNSW